MDSNDNYSTAEDLAIILNFALKNKVFKEVFSAREYEIASINKKINSTLVTYSKSTGLDLSDVVGAKSGYTDGAGVCLASIASIKFSHATLRVSIFVASI